MKISIEHPHIANNTPIYRVAGFDKNSQTACVLIAGTIEGEFLRGSVIIIINKNGHMDETMSTGHSYYVEKGVVEQIGKIDNKII